MALEFDRFFDLEQFAKSRYQLLGNGSKFPGNNANLLDVDVCESQLLKVLEKHIKPKSYRKLRILKEKFEENHQDCQSINL